MNLENRPKSHVFYYSIVHSTWVQISLPLFFIFFFWWASGYSSSHNLVYTALVLGVTTELFLNGWFKEDIFSNFIMSLFSCIIAGLFFTLFCSWSFVRNGWPFFFLIPYIFLAFPILHTSIAPKSGMAVTLLQTLVVVYWFFSRSWTFQPLALILLSVPVAYTLIRSFVQLRMRNFECVFFSLWSCLVMSFLGVAYASAFLSFVGGLDGLVLNNQVQSMPILFIESFVFGLSIVYISQNVILSVGYLRSASRLSGERIHQLNNILLEKFAPGDLDIRVNGFIVIGCCLIFFPNYFFHFVSPNSAIWLAFPFVPLAAVK